MLRFCHAIGDCEYWNEEYQPVCCPNETPKDACYFPGSQDPEDVETRCKDYTSCDKGAFAVEGSPFTLPNGRGCAYASGYSEWATSLPKKPLCCKIDKLEVVSTVVIPQPN